MRRDFGGPDDLAAMQSMASRLWTPRSRFHPGQLTWNRYSRPVDPTSLDDSEAIAVWTDGDETVGFGWAEAPDWLELQVDPARPDIAEELVEWFEEVSDAEAQSALVMEGDVAEQALAAAGFEPDRDAPWFTHHVVEVEALPDVPLVEGYRLRHVEPHEVRERAAVHAAAWSQLGPSTVDATAYGRLMAAWPYRHDLDWVAVDEEGEMVASALVWLDPPTGVGLVEPVGCVPEHRGRGLARSVTLAALHALRSAGGTVAQVTPRGDAAYPGPQRLYRSIGFRPTARTVTWTRSLD
ncbi:GNAT family N-acetyltransferase [Humibacillus xanthopallidus]|uniref:Acetyltransferase (GNAT) family protein n=1 Tax=Humibacillus xanthopallidus TaxID=412689 RepID=A0A543HVU6_9MICO|nr:GNAT family N-acetyltransferase [Humibacillus xanthopallidus]TQM62446.1 acetyltransferase (GNAT) family protein [Humibacillus xanthopallidus]